MLQLQAWPAWIQPLGIPVTPGYLGSSRNIHGMIDPIFDIDYILLYILLYWLMILPLPHPRLVTPVKVQWEIFRGSQSSGWSTCGIRTGSQINHCISNRWGLESGYQSHSSWWTSCNLPTSNKYSMLWMLQIRIIFGFISTCPVCTPSYLLGFPLGSITVELRPLSTTSRADVPAQPADLRTSSRNCDDVHLVWKYYKILLLSPIPMDSQILRLFSRFSLLEWL